MSNTGRTWFKKGHNFWLGKKRPYLKNTGAEKTMFKKGLKPWNKYLDFRKCKQCQKEFYPREVKKLFCSKSCYTNWQIGKPSQNKGKKFLSNSGKNHHFWKGESVSYSGLHHWIRRELGKAKNCEFCSSEKDVEWANKSRRYHRNLDDWISLCVKCHKKYDNHGKKIKEARKKIYARSIQS